MAKKRLPERENKDRKEIDQIISSCDVCHLALSKDNKPYLVTIAFAYDGNSIFFHGAKEGQKIDYIEENIFFNRAFVIDFVCYMCKLRDECRKNPN